MVQMDKLFFPDVSGSLYAVWFKGVRKTDHNGFWGSERYTLVSAPVLIYFKPETSMPIKSLVPQS